MNGFTTATEALIAKMEAAHAAEVERLEAKAYETKCYCDGYMAELEKMDAEVERLTVERDAAVARAEKAEADAAQFCAGLCVHPSGVIGDDGGSACCPITGTRDAHTIQAAQSDRERRLEFALRRCQQLADDGVDDPAGPHNVLTHIFNTVEDALAAAPDKPQCAALSPEPWVGPEGEE